MNNTQEIEISVEQAQKAVNVKEAIHRLLDNSDFKLVIMEGYLEEEPVRLTKLLGDPSIRNSPKQLDAVTAELTAIGLFDNHLRSAERMGLNAEADLKEYARMELAEDADETDE